MNPIPGCIVLIDDIPDNLQLLTRTLRQHGYQVRAAATGAMGLETIQAELPDLVLLDLMMPDMDGFEVCRRLKERPDTAALPVIFLTARNQTEDVVRGFQVGGVDYVGKPFQIEEMLARINTHIRLRRADQDRAQIDRRLHEAQKLESLAILAGGVAHDFNNLLTVILGNAELVRMELTAQSPALNYVRQIESASRRAAFLCEQMLAYSGRGRFRLGSLDLAAKVREMTDLLRHALPAQAELNLELTAVPPIEADPGQISQALTNLVLNAGEALPDGAGVITLVVNPRQLDSATLAATILTPELQGGDYVCLEVRDTGCGMTAETLAHIFDPFFTTKFTGRGLGLAAVLGIVRGHQGAIEVESEPGAGSIFRLFFPVATHNQS